MVRRLCAGVALSALLAVVPVMVFVVVGLPLPAIDELRTAAVRRRLDDEALVGVGTAIFVVLWVWFTCSAMMELVLVVRWRVTGRSRTLPALAPGPTRWVRGLVRAVAVSGVSATLAFGGSPDGAGLVGASSSGVVGPSVMVVDAGDPAPSRVVGAASAPVAARTPLVGLGTAVMLAGGVIVLLDTRRRQRLRASAVGARLDLPSLDRVRTELTLRALAPDERLARLDVAVRATAPAMVASGATLLVALAGHTGEVRLLPSSPVRPTGLWSVDPDGWLVVSPTVLLEDLASGVHSDAPPCPGLVHLGRSAAGECFVDLESIGILHVDLSDPVPFVRAIAESLRVSPFLDPSRVVCVGVDDATELDSLDAALDLAVATLGPARRAAGSVGTFERRVVSAGGESWEPIIVVSSYEPSVSECAALAASGVVGGGLGVVVAGRPGAADQTWSTECRWSIRGDDSGAVLEPAGVRLRPVAVTTEQVAEVHELLSAESAPLEIAAPVVPIDARSGGRMTFVEPEWSLLVRVLGPVEVTTRDGRIVEFDRSKALELVVWLSQHRERPTRSAARAALWELDVRDATFANVVSEARRALARAAEPPIGEEWIGRTLTDALPLHRCVVTDADLLVARMRHAQGMGHRAAIEVLTPGVDLLVGLPFAGTGYLWSDAEGLSSSLVLQAVGAAVTLASHHLAVGDVEGVFWATGQGLRVLSGHEELIALRMRAHAGQGDLAGVRVEWERYERSLANDPWSAGEPSPKLAALRRELLGGGLSRVRGSNP